jgi:hypothetical protein
VKNIGFDSSAENTRGMGGKLMTRSCGDIFNQKLKIASEADSIRWDKEVFYNHYRRISGRLSLIEKILVKLQRVLGKE